MLFHCYKKFKQKAREDVEDYVTYLCTSTAILPSYFTSASTLHGYWPFGKWLCNNDPHGSTGKFNPKKVLHTLTILSNDICLFGMSKNHLIWELRKCLSRKELCKRHHSVKISLRCMWWWLNTFSLPSLVSPCFRGLHPRREYWLEIKMHYPSLP